MNALAYPSAALFGLAMANSLAVVKATLRQVHGAATIDDGVSGDYLVNEMTRVAERLETLVEPGIGWCSKLSPGRRWRLGCSPRLSMSNCASIASIRVDPRSRP